MSRSSRTIRFVQNMACTGVYQITAMVMGFITPRLMILYYGSEVNGLIVSVTEFLTYFKMVEAGLAAAAIAALYKPLAEGDDAAVSGVVSAAKRFYTRAGWLFCGLTLVFAAVYPFVVPVSDLNGVRMSALSEMALILSMGISGALEFFTLSRYRVLLTADQKTYMVSLTSMASLLISTGLIVALPYFGASVIWVRLAASLTILLRSVILSRYTARNYPRIRTDAKPNRSALSKRWDALYVDLTEVYQQGAGVILASLITRDAGILSVYGLYHMVTVGLWGILKMGTSGIYSIFGNLLVSGDKPAFQKAYRDFECLYQIANSILFGAAAVLIVPFVTLYTNGVEDVNYTVPVIGMLIIAEGLSNQCKMPMDLMIASSGTFREVRWHCVAQVAVTTAVGGILGLLLLPCGAVASVCGILVGVIVGNLLRTGLQLYFVPQYVTGLSWVDSLKRIVRMLATVIVIAAPLLVLVEPPQRFYTWFMYGAVLAVYATAVSFASAWLFDREALMNLFGRFKGMVNGLFRA